MQDSPAAPPKTTKPTFVTPSISMTPELLGKVDELAKSKDFTRAQLIRDACRLYMAIHARGLMEIVMKIVQSRDVPDGTPGNEEVV